MSKEMHNSQIKEYIINKSNRIFSNSNKDLYKILLKNVFLYTNSVKWIIPNSNRLKQLLDDDQIMQAFNSFIKTKKISIVLADQKINKFIQKIKNINNKNLSFKQIVNLKDPQDILIWDDIGYRFSPDFHKLTGCACANDPNFTTKCLKIFEKCSNNQ